MSGPTTELMPSQVTTATPAASAVWRRAMVFGTGFGIAVGEKHLELAIVRARPSGATLPARACIRDFRTRPAAEWGTEVRKFLETAGEKRLAATLLLPRDAVIVRVLALPGVPDKDIPGAIELQLDNLHPWRDEEIASGWSRVGLNSIMLGLARKSVLDQYETLFAEAGILMAAVTFSAAVIHPALRIWSAAPASFFCYLSGERGRTEVYGESEARPVYSAEFPAPPERALALARAELRLAPEQQADPLTALLPKPATANTAALESGTAQLAYAAALAGATPRLTRFTNLLPAEHRASHDRVQYLVPSILGGLLVVALVVVFGIFPALEQKRYRDELAAATRRLEPAALRVQALEKSAAATQSRIALLDQFRTRPQADLDVLNELTRLLPSPVWTSTVEIFPDSVMITGEAEQAAPLLKVLDSSPLFENSEFAMSVTRTGQTEQFRIRSGRRGRTGRTTP